MNIRGLRWLSLLWLLTLAATTIVSAETSSAGATDARLHHYSIRPDFRRCVSPRCGGYFIKRVNAKATRCADGMRRDECYVAEIQWNAAGFSGDPGAALVRGVLRPREFAGFGVLGVLAPKAVWRAAGTRSMRPLDNNGHPSGGWFGLRQNGVVCIAAPCYNIEERLLGRKFRQIISGVDLSDVDADPTDLATAMKQLQRSELTALGENVLIPDEGPAGDGVTMVASDFFLRVWPERDDSLRCDVDAECTVSVFHSPVRSKNECYCTHCPQPINALVAKENQASWQRYCKDFGFAILDDSSATLTCPQVLCVLPPPVGCVKNQCVGLERSPLLPELFSR